MWLDKDRSGTMGSQGRILPDYSEDVKTTVSLYPVVARTRDARLSRVSMRR
jgi:hypothetical protein